ncbi:DUF4760 domain-containing protein [Halomonas lysinitropha]|uniref:DUF4760 domain-containing protein n=1 Tax=Halomonas lysinitropha TaxID=2607506 RepID=A0A5K1I9L2_9GAMM|nr:hypothetical protein [Halomonas lysinitropha]VVZ96828.1 hypothetical protein HALO32_02935 [Halomonas lysinitropha]
MQQTVIAISSAIGAMGVLGVFWQCFWSKSSFRLALKSLESDHERSRREKAIDLLCHWDSTLTDNSAAARKFAESLTFEQSKCLYAQEPFSVDSKHYGLFLGALPPALAKVRKAEQKYDGEKIDVSERESSEIRWSVITYLNSLETILSAARHNVADKDMIYEQFVYLISPEKGHYLLADFRKAAGGARTYPSTEEFATELKEKAEETVPGKGPVA